jgi:DDE superfamily endonuclease
LIILLIFVFSPELNQMRKLPNSDIVFPYFIAGDEAFPLSANLMHPYSGRFLPDDKHYFNQRLSRARGVVENSFGILSARWRLFHNAIEFAIGFFVIF